ncbi:5-(carboxyamino)imidazole ribonucleotide synthase [Vagococcus humatus]|uniref:5-(carboxyamino)imidazole ribonucleotide synthase n=1 Tax=Vagococcus humatus TaxID=1889241 RepID=UPI001FB47DE1|nr:ATP-grasp domain-containing protein [Vagococcus humatus]
MAKLFIPGQTIGIIGGGHIARMLTLAAKTLGFHVGILDSEENSAAGQIADWQIVAKVTDELALVKFAERCDVLTYEHEKISLSQFRQLQNIVDIPQGFDTLSFMQDRFLERAFLEEINMNIAPYTTIVQFTDIEDSIDSIGFPCVLKTTQNFLGDNMYHVMNSIKDIKGCLPLIHSGTCILEAVIPFEHEVSIVVVGNGLNEYKVYPVAENQLDGEKQWYQTHVPAVLDLEVLKELERVALTIAQGLHLKGVLTVELFVTESGMIYVNRLISLPIESGSYTLEATSLSQYEAHIRGICGWPLPEIKLISPAITLGIRGGELARSIGQIPYHPNWYYHYYSKNKQIFNQLMGHVTILTQDIQSSLKEVKESRIWIE